MQPITSVQKIVVTRLQNIGDAIMTTPILYRLRQLYPQAELIFITRPTAVGAVERLPFLDKVIVFPDEHPLFVQWKVIQAFRHADIAFFCDSTHRIAVLAWLAGAKRRIGMKHNRGRYLTDPIAWNKTMDVTFDPALYAGMLKTTTGIDVMNSPGWDKYFFSEANAREISHVEQLANKHGFSLDEPYIVFSMYSGRLRGEQEKNWPAEKWQELWAKMAAQSKVKGILTGNNPLHITFGKNVVDLSEQLSLIEFGYLIKKAALVVGVCSGPLHIGRAFGVPTMGLYGPTSPKYAAPPENIANIVSSAPCAPCHSYYGKECANPYCMGLITAEEVYKAIAKFLQERGIE